LKLTARLRKQIQAMSIRADDHRGLERACVKAAALFAFGIAAQAGEARASPVDDAAAAGVLGTYECNAGSTAVVLASQPVKVHEHTPSNPLVRVTVSSAPKADLLWWDKSKQIWKDDPSADLKIKQIEVKEKYWAVTFEGTFGDRIATAVSGYLSWFDGLAQSAKPTLVLTQTSPMLASASALSCDKL
jgi:hypothetical protein